MSTQARTRVLFAIPSLDRGGPDRVFFEILTGLDRTMFAPMLMVSEPTGHYLSKLSSDVPVEVLGPEGRYPVIRAVRAVRKISPDIVFGTLRMVITLGIGASAFPRKTRLMFRPASPVSADLEALMQTSIAKHRIARRLVIEALRRADAVVCQSRAVRDDLKKLLGERAMLHTVANPIDVDQVAAAGEGSAPLPGRPSLVSVGRLVPLKGYDVLLRAMVDVRRHYPDVHLTIVGEGPERQRLEQLIAVLSLGDTVSLVGYHTEPLRLVCGADLFVLASRYDAFANAALEALACGTPVVLTDCPGANSELVVPGINGRLAFAVTPTAVASALEMTIAELASYDRLEIRSDCGRRYASQKIVKAYQAVFSSVASSHHTESR